MLPTETALPEGSQATENVDEFDPFAIERPHPRLFYYYLVLALLTGPISPIMFMSLYFRYMTLHYKFDDSGVSMRWGILFRKEVYLTYRRLQDIHLTKNFIQRWMGLAKISLQTASGSSQAEMSIEGILEAEELRDFLYSRMRGAKNESSAKGVTTASSAAGADADFQSRATHALEGIRDALQKMSQQNSGEQR